MIAEFICSRTESICIEHVHFFILYTLISLLVRVLSIRWVYRYICAHSDGGGWDAGTDYSFVPTLKPQHSIVAEGYDAWPRRGRLLSWFVLPLIPIYWLLQAVTYVWLLWSMFVYWMTEGQVVRENFNVPTEWYS